MLGVKCFVHLIPSVGIFVQVTELYKNPLLLLDDGGMRIQSFPEPSITE